MIHDQPQQKPVSLRKRFKSAIVVAILLLLITAVWIYTAPRRTLGAIRDAAKAGDSERLSELVDFPAVRESLKEQLRASFAEEMAKTTSENSKDPFAAAGAALGMMLGTNLIETFVDAAISPSGIAKLASGGRPVLPNTKKDLDTEDEEGKGKKISTEMGYETFSLYAVKFNEPGKLKEGITLSLRRSGLSWRLVSVRFAGLSR
jgi:Protein of unknown function (DUF2939)